MLRAYCDMSRSERITLIAGNVGTPEQWAVLDAEWRRNLEYWELNDFHMADLPVLMGHRRADLCIRSFAHIVGKSGVYGVSAGVENAFYDAQKWASRFPTPYHVCADMLFDSLNTHVPLNLGGGPIDLIFDRDTHQQEAVHSLLEFYKDSRIFGKLRFSDRCATQSLQTADLAAGVVRKGWVEDNFFDGLPMAGKVVRDVLGNKHFGVALSFETDRIVRDARAKAAALDSQPD